MKSLLVKIEKTKLLWKRSGFFGGIKILFSYGLTFLKAFFVSSGDVLFISGGVGDSAFYRAYNPAEELRMHGFKTSTTISDNPFLHKLANKFSVFVFHRVSYNGKIEKMIAEIKRQGKEIIFDADDLIHDPTYLVHMDYFQKMNRTQQEQYKNGIGAEIINDPYVKTCTTTVSYLANKLKEKNKKVIIVPNKFSEKEFELTNSLLQTQKKDDGKIRIIYCSGTLSHNKDFATIKEALLKILDKYGQTRLVLMGPLDVSEDLLHKKEQIEITPRASRNKFFVGLYGADINLAPLELNNPFCESKSALKFTEAGALKIPTVAVRNQTFSEAIDDGEDGFLADNAKEWVEKIEKLINSKELREKMGEKARQKVEKKYTNKNSDNIEYYEYIRSRIN